MNTFVVNGLAVALVAAILPQQSLLRSACIQAARLHFHIKTGAKQDGGDPRAWMAGLSCCNLLAEAVSMRNIDTSVILFGMSVGGGVAVMPTVSCCCNVVRRTLGFGNLFRDVSLVLSSLQTLGNLSRQATVVNTCLVDDVLDVARSYFIGCLQACVHEC